MTLSKSTISWPVKNRQNIEPTRQEQEQSSDAPADIQELAEQRWQAKQNKDWAASDQLRDQLTSAGWTIKDNPDGYELSQS